MILLFLRRIYNSFFDRMSHFLFLLHFFSILSLSLLHCLLSLGLCVWFYSYVELSWWVCHSLQQLRGSDREEDEILWQPVCLESVLLESDRRILGGRKPSHLYCLKLPLNLQQEGTQKWEEQRSLRCHKTGRKQSRNERSRKGHARGRMRGGEAFWKPMLTSRRWKKWRNRKEGSNACELEAGKEASERLNYGWEYL